jgi:hypothetical protein
MNILSLSPALAHELADHDARRLLDIGLVRGEDGSLRLADDPSLLASHAVADQRFAAIAVTIRAFFRDVRDVAFHSNPATRDAA